MFGFSREVRVAGVDFGTASIKIVELVLKGSRKRLTNYGEVVLHTGTSKREQENGMTYEVRKRKAFQTLIKKMKLKSTDLYVAIPGHSGLVALVKFPKMNEDELAQAVQYEAHKYVPTDINDVVLSWEVLSESSEAASAEPDEHDDALAKLGKQVQKKPAKTMEVLLVAALQKNIQKIESILKGLPVSISTIELETFSMARALVGDTPGTHLIIDIGYKICNMVLVHDGRVRMNRNVDVGGTDLTKTISDSMNISLVRADQLKKSGRDFFQQKSIAILFPSIELVVNEAQRIIQAFSQDNSEKKLSSVVLSGGTAGLSGLDAYFEKELGVPCRVGEPWKGVEHDAVLDQALSQRAGAYAVALGLALRGIEEHEKK